MDIVWEELTYGLPDWQRLVHVVIRLLAAAILGAILGFQREKAGKPAGVRTHILVALGTCIFVLACSGYGMNSDGLSRVIQGIVTGRLYRRGFDSKGKGRARHSGTDDGGERLGRRVGRRRRRTRRSRLGTARNAFGAARPDICRRIRIRRR